MKNDNTEYRLKLQLYSKFTILKISRIVTSVDRLHKVHSIVIRNDTEEEVIKELTEKQNEKELTEDAIHEMALKVAGITK